MKALSENRSRTVHLSVRSNSFPHNHSPAEVLGWTTVQRYRSPEQLHHIFYATRYLRQPDRLGYAHFRRWKLYGEATLARQKAVI